MKNIKEVWVIVKDTNVCHGHGEFATEPVLAYSGWDVKATYPAFGTKELAQKYIDDNKVNCSRPHRLVFNDELEKSIER
jgi:hypothetical protein